MVVTPRRWVRFSRWPYTDHPYCTSCWWLLPPFSILMAGDLPIAIEHMSFLVSHKAEIHHSCVSKQSASTLMSPVSALINKILDHNQHWISFMNWLLFLLMEQQLPLTVYHGTLSIKIKLVPFICERWTSNCHQRLPLVFPFFPNLYFFQNPQR